MKKEDQIGWNGLFTEPRAISERTDPDYVDRVDRRNLDIYLRLRSEARRKDFIANLDVSERRGLKQKLDLIQRVQDSKPSSLSESRRPEELKIELAILNKEVMAYFEKNPQALHELSPREFEVFIAGILEDMGCEVVVTPQTRDKGRDILAVFPTPFGKLLTIVECKRLRHDRPVGIDVVERFLYVLEQRDRASCGLIATTSYFSPDAIQTANELKYRLKLREFEGIREWVANYGRWVKNSASQLWVPNI